MNNLIENIINFIIDCKWFCIMFGFLFILVCLVILVLPDKLDTYYYYYDTYDNITIFEFYDNDCMKYDIINDNVIKCKYTYTFKDSELIIFNEMEIKKFILKNNKLVSEKLTIFGYETIEFKPTTKNFINILIRDLKICNLKEIDKIEKSNSYFNDYINYNYVNDTNGSSGDTNIFNQN